MTGSDAAKFGAALDVLGEVFGEPVSQTRAEAYFDALEDWPLEWVLEGIQRCIKMCRFFPKPAEIITAADEARESFAQSRIAVEKQQYALPPGQDQSRLSTTPQAIRGILPPWTGRNGDEP